LPTGSALLFDKPKSQRYIKNVLNQENDDGATFSVDKLRFKAVKCSAIFDERARVKDFIEWIR
jgi:hypothetical protein